MTRMTLRFLLQASGWMLVPLRQGALEEGQDGGF